MQLALPLPPTKKKLRHGGARLGAGRPTKYPKRKPGDPMPHVARPKLDRHQPAHVTVRVARGIPSLQKELLRNRVRAALRQVRRKAEEDGAPFQIVEFKIESDHLHLVVEAKSAKALSNGMRAFEIRVARAVNGALGRGGQVFPERYHRRDLATPTEVRNVLSYVLNNGRKHVRHIGDRVAYVDGTTSGEGFDGWSEPVHRYYSLEDDRVPWTKVSAWTWLLRVGWRRRGLISPFAVPGGRARP